MESRLFNAMTTPPQIFGVDSDLFIMMITGALVLFDLSGSLSYCIVMMPIYLFAYIEGKKDMYFFKVIMKKLECNFTKNKRLWGCHAYEPY